jgi:hypothetical protein
LAERFTRAVEQLGNAKVGVRLGGIYGLEQIAKQSPGDRLQVFEVLCAYVREHARKDPKRPQSVELREHALDVEAAMTVLGRRDVSADDPLLDLHEVDLSGSKNLLGGVNLRKVNLQGADLRGAMLDRTNLQQADLRSADLREAFLTSANLQGASLTAAKLQGAYLNNTNLQEVFDLEGANIKGAFADRGATKWPDGFDWRAAGVRQM